VLRFRNLGSGSSGNATVVEARGTSRVNRLLVDCGLGIRQLDQRLQRAGLAADDIDAIFVTHEHSDHIGCARQLAIRHQIPVWMSHGTHAGVGSPDFQGLLQLARDGVAIELGELHLMPFTVPHDAREPLQLRCSDGASTLGILTDLGHATEHVLSQLAACQALLLECNHDADGAHGHLSNARAGEIARALRHPGLGTVVAAHLSQQNNRPELARTALAEALERAADDIAVADQVHGTEWFTVG
jgi:phosphoribosyl 1,2-cyclic phosphodiesterase